MTWLIFCGILRTAYFTAAFVLSLTVPELATPAVIIAYSLSVILLRVYDVWDGRRRKRRCSHAR